MGDYEFVVVYFGNDELGEKGRLFECSEVVKKKITSLSEGYECIENFDDFEEAFLDGELEGKKIIFQIGLSEGGTNLDYYKMIELMNREENRLHKHLDETIAVMIIDGMSELFTKDVGRKLAFTLSKQGCTLPGKPLVEATGSLSNFEVTANLLKTTKKQAYLAQCENLVSKLNDFSIDEYKITMPNILAIHASNKKTSNSLMLWEKIARYLEGAAYIEEIRIRNGEIWDCRGCKFEQCFHHGENDTCFYGGHMVEKVYPAILKSEIIVLICPNYNDSVSADIMAMINRLTAIFRTNDFSKKRVYAVVVSGYSGGDLVAEQILGALNMNKSFMLPGNFVLMATANSPGSIEEVEDIDELAEEFAKKILMEEF